MTTCSDNKIQSQQRRLNNPTKHFQSNERFSIILRNKNKADQVRTSGKVIPQESFQHELALAVDKVPRTHQNEHCLGRSEITQDTSPRTYLQCMRLCAAGGSPTRDHCCCRRASAVRQVLVVSVGARPLLLCRPIHSRWLSQTTLTLSLLLAPLVLLPNLHL